MDKTELIAKTNRYLNTEQQFICVSRQRRFGRSMALKMLVAYYSRGSDSRALFADYRIGEGSGENLCKTDKQFIFLIDEWDCVMRERQEAEDLQKQYLDFLRNLLKDQPYMDFDGLRADIVQMLGVGRVKVNTFSFQNDMCNTRVLEGYTGEILLVGINYDRTDRDKLHSCVIGRINTIESRNPRT